ncbi:hypothetical protein HMF8227_00571 [Saliniradius amylolyticus]|uniref:DoxX protein n=1 Tax=Saliniradius amylolyticus TaxID=2183582 RepID=A0A2S2E221_9ALTE|nr:hypothetical protein [Saliniradius amylolyticus]AWL11067.1 hypothetical protein HMF8227_00571 [Saliniradius amylolyticus]
MQTSSSHQLILRLSWSLLALRLGVFMVMLVWSLDKFVNPAHGGRVFEHFYGLEISQSLINILGGLQLVLVIAFVLGLKKRFTYGLMFVLHGASTLSSYAQYLDAFNNLLFFAAWPMWAACLTLYLLRDWDHRWTLGKAG